jgi:hypothetical protein
LANRFEQRCPKLKARAYLELLEQVYATGERYVARHTPIRLIRSASGVLEDRYIDFVYEPIFDETNRVSGIFIEGFDVTETIGYRKNSGN